MKDFQFPEAWPFDFGAYLRNVRERRGLRVADVAEYSQGKLAPSTVSVIERGLSQGGPSLRQLEGFSAAFDIPTIYLFALAYSAANELDPTVIDKVWLEFDLDRTEREDEARAAVVIPRQQLELLGLTQDELRFFSLREGGLLSAEAARQGYVTGCDIIGVDGERTAPAGSPMVGWWQEQKKLLVYRQDLDSENVLVPAQRGGEPYLIVDKVATLKHLGVIVWRSGPVPQR